MLHCTMNQRIMNNKFIQCAAHQRRYSVLPNAHKPAGRALSRPAGVRPQPSASVSALRFFTSSSAYLVSSNAVSFAFQRRVLGLLLWELGKQ